MANDCFVERKCCNNICLEYITIIWRRCENISQVEIAPCAPDVKRTCWEDLKTKSRVGVRINTKCIITYL